MLIEFSVTNYRSFREKQTLSMSASGYFKELEEQNCFDTGIVGLKLLKSVVIYGPNASGKSNLISAISFMRHMVISSAKQTQESEELNVTPFLLDQASKDKGSEFEIIFVEGGIRYQYGFALTRKRIHHEWLIAYPEGRPQRWFEREYDPKSDQENYEFGPKFLGRRLRQDWKSVTRSNALFLSVAVQFKSEQLKSVFDWFQNRLGIISSHDLLNPKNVYTATVCKTDEGKKRIIDFLNAADLSIADVQVKVPISEMFSRINSLSAQYKEMVMAAEKIIENARNLPDGNVKRKRIAEALRILEESKKNQKQLKELYENTEKLSEEPEIEFLHKATDVGQLVAFSDRDESVGTRNLFSFAGIWLDALDNDKILFVDEIDSSLHPLVVHQLVRLLHQLGHKAQLVFTTHDTTILSQDFIRRDQIWFVEKDSSNASRLYSLSDFKVRKQEALEQGYLRGRYGAIPFIKELIEK